jgi:NhaA family Na+:H+ antiporter
MSTLEASARLDRPVQEGYDHVLGPANADITVVEYGSYACPHCRAANENIARIRDRFGDRLRYVFRHRPLTGSEIARRAAELVERARTPEQFWDAHVKLMTRSAELTEEDLSAVARDLHLSDESPAEAEENARRARERVLADERSARASGVLYTPTFFVNGRRYEGTWDERSFSDAIVGTVAHRVRSAALDFARWAPSAGLLLLLASVLAIALSNSRFGESFDALWHSIWGITVGGLEFHNTLLHWINDGLLSIFFFVVALEIKRELTVGRLSSARLAALPAAAAIGGMVVPALLYRLVIPEARWEHGWGVPMATDTAFAVALIAVLGRRVPIALRTFLTAAAIVDDIGAIAVVALFYSGELRLEYAGAALAVIASMILLNRWRVYRTTPYILLGIVLWGCVYASGLHATLAGVLLAFFIPTRPPANLNLLYAQATAIVQAEAERGDRVLRHGPSLPALHALDEIHDRLESPADRLLRNAGPRSSYIVLPLFALANAGIVLAPGLHAGHEWLMNAIVVALAIGKPLGFVLASVLAVRLGLAVKPDEFSWAQLAGAGALAGIGFTMSLFIASQAFPVAADFAAAKLAVYVGSLCSALIGVVVLWRAGQSTREREPAMAPAATDE